MFLQMSVDCKRTTRHYIPQGRTLASTCMHCLWQMATELNSEVWKCSETVSQFLTLININLKFCLIWRFLKIFYQTFNIVLVFWIHFPYRFFAGILPAVKDLFSITHNSHGGGGIQLLFCEKGVRLEPWRHEFKFRPRHRNMNAVLYLILSYSPINELYQTS
jgi:hypothetical protein